MSEPSRIAPGMMAIGLGCRVGVSAEAVTDLVRKAIERSGRNGRAALFTAVEKQGEAGLREAAVRLGLPLVFLPREALKAMADGAVTTSERVVQLFGVPSLAETAALDGAGAGSELIVSRISHDGVTCAVAATPARERHQP